MKPSAPPWWEKLRCLDAGKAEIDADDIFNALERISIGRPVWDLGFRV